MAALAALALSACGGEGSAEDPFSEGGASGDTVVVGSANFPESELLMQLYAQVLEANGVSVETRPNIGAREIYMEAFEGGDIDLLPEYNGALLAYLSGEKGVPKDVTSSEDSTRRCRTSCPRAARRSRNRRRRTRTPCRQ